ncbi:MAG: hypothetical protein ACO3JL_16960, partial [Myxococcota bacterium]
TDAFVEAARLCLRAGCHHVLVDAADDGLLAATLSPLGNPGASLDARSMHLARVVEGIASTGMAVGVVLTVEELAPSGLSPAEGITIGQRAVTHGASFLVVRAGTARLAARWSRETRMGEDETWMASALWLRGRVGVPVWAAGPIGDLAVARSIAGDAGLAGVIDWKPGGSP